MKKRIAILGSTGSIGENALDVVRRLNNGHRMNGGFQVWGLSAQTNARRLMDQIRGFRPAVAVLSDERAAADLKVWARRSVPSVQVWGGAEGVERLAAHGDVDLLLSAVVGAAGLLPLLGAVRQGKKIALANKEALIVAGDLLMETAKKTGAQFIPVDSEHSAIFQCLEAGADLRNGSTSKNGTNAPSIRRIILTASGGAFYRRKGSLNDVSVTEALAHPTWKMGNKITIDCATLTNKGLEAIEAHHLFGVPLENIHVVIHPQSIVHSLVEFNDGAMLAQLSHPDMRLPIQYALTHPERHPTSVRPLKLEEIQKLEFYRPDFRRFPCLKFALDAGKKAGTWPAVFNGANEVAVRAFLEERIPFTGIPRLIEKVMNAYARESKRSTKKRAPGLEDILSADLWGRGKAEELISRKSI